MFKVFNSHLNIRKRSRHFHLVSRQISTTEEENPNIVYLDEDASEPNSLVQNTIASPMSAEFVPFS